MSTKSPTSVSSNRQKHDQPSESAREAKRTWAFVIAAIGCLLITGLVEWYSRPATIEEFGKVGQEFYPDFTDPTTATSLTVSVIDPEEVKPLEFSVKQAENGQWVIPSHHNYPADAADQLAKTASSVIGIERGAMVSRWPSDHARYGVVDPQTDSVGIDELEGIGKRITLADKDGNTLASYIVGKRVEDGGEGNRFYVRHPNEDETYIADLDINLTTRFGDWVNTDLLDITAADVRRIELNDYSFDELKGTVTGNVESLLTRTSSSEDWQLAGLDEATQQVNEDSVRETLNTLANLEIVGVRPKQAGLTPDLKLDRNAIRAQRDVDRLQSDLLTRGFLLQPGTEDKNVLELKAREGEMFVGTDDGLLYRLYFGRAFTGSEEELEIGLSADDNQQAATKDADAKAEESEEPADGKETADESEASESGTDDAEDKPEGNGKPGRYVFVRVNFDPSLLGEQLTEPVEPQEPAEIKELEEKIKQAESESPDADQNTEEASEEGEKETSDEAAATDGETKPDDEAEETDAQKLQRLRDEFAAAQSEYRSQLAAYEAYQEKQKEGQEQADDLNRRFALWYYVIPGDSYDKLSLDRENLIQAKEPEEGETAPETPATESQAGSSEGPALGGLSDAVMKEPTDLQAPENQADPNAGPSTPTPEAAPTDTPQAGDAPKAEETPKAEDNASGEEPPKAEDAPNAEEGADESSNP